MPYSPFSANRKVQLLALEKDLHNLAVIKRFAKNYSLQLSECISESKAYHTLSSSFFNIVICNTDLLSLNGSFIRNLRNLRGYETIPILAITGDRDPIHISNLLESGADGYVTTPLTLEVLEAHFQLFLRRQLFLKANEDETIKRDLNLNKGALLLCTVEKSMPLLPVYAIEAPIITVNDETELFRAIDEHNIWVILLSPEARWALPLVPRIKGNPAHHMQIILLKEKYLMDADVVDFFNNGGDDITSLNKPAFILARQINSRIERELYFKQKYVNALKLAAHKLPVHYQTEASFRFSNWEINIFHHPDDDIPGGDFYEVISLEGNSRLLLLGDVMGKNWEAWHFSLAYLAYIRSTVRRIAQDHNLNPALFLRDLNQVLCNDLQLAENFTTLNALLIHDNSDEVKLASAGGMPLYQISAVTGQNHPFQAQGPLLGINVDSTYECVSLRLNKGDILFACTDGYMTAPPKGSKTKKRNSDYADTIASAVRQSPANLAEADRLIAEKNGQPYQDDRTLVTVTLN